MDRSKRALASLLLAQEELVGVLNRVRSDAFVKEGRVRALFEVIGSLLDANVALNDDVNQAVTEDLDRGIDFLALSVEVRQHLRRLEALSSKNPLTAPPAPPTPPHGA